MRNVRTVLRLQSRLAPASSPSPFYLRDAVVTRRPLANPRLHTCATLLSSHVVHSQTPVFTPVPRRPPARVRARAARGVAVVELPLRVVAGGADTAGGARRAAAVPRRP
eukprot:scaffold23312_cov112-Isochrysis_galbana.AAC.4